MLAVISSLNVNYKLDFTSSCGLPPDIEIDIEMKTYRRYLTIAFINCENNNNAAHHNILKRSHLGFVVLFVGGAVGSWHSGNQVLQEELNNSSCKIAIEDTDVILSYFFGNFFICQNGFSCLCSLFIIITFFKTQTIT